MDPSREAGSHGTAPSASVWVVTAGSRRSRSRTDPTGELAVTPPNAYAHTLPQFDLKAGTGRSKREVEALTYLVGRESGLDTGRSAFYLAAWEDDDTGVIEERLDWTSTTVESIDLMAHRTELAMP